MEKYTILNMLTYNKLTNTLYFRTNGVLTNIGPQCVHIPVAASLQLDVFIIDGTEPPSNPNPLS